NTGSGTLTGGTLDGLNLDGTVFDVNVEEMLIELGDGDDQFFVLGTEPKTTIRTHGGNDRVVVGKNGKLDDVDGELFIDAGEGDYNELVIDDSENAVADPYVVVTADSVTGLAPAAIHFTASGGFFGSDLVDGEFTAGIEISAGAGADTLIVTDADPRYVELHAGSGNDTVTLEQPANTFATFGGLTVFGDDGDDFITGGVQADVLIGGLGEDEIHGGDADDVVVGDNADIRRDGDYVVQRISTRD